jgi:hypothetical protein
MNAVTAIAQQPKTFTQGIYRVKDIGLLTGSTYNVRNNSTNSKAIVIIIDSNQMMQEFIRLEPNSPNYLIKPLDYDTLIVIIGASDIVFS